MTLLPIGCTVELDPLSAKSRFREGDTAVWDMKLSLCADGERYWEQRKIVTLEVILSATDCCATTFLTVGPDILQYTLNIRRA